jgi:type I restriction enzyme M protein
MRIQSHQKQHGQYYTASAFGALLVERFHEESVKVAVELGVGNGALLDAVTGRWPDVQYISVDIDPLHHRPSANRRAPHMHYCIDALDTELHQSIGLPQGVADVAVCNPPFVIAHWRASFNTLLARAGLPVPSNAARVGSDLLFMAQNLWMLKEKGQLGIIVPAGIISGIKNMPVRTALLEQYNVREIIELPSTAFKGTEVKTFILNICKDSTGGKPIKLLRYNSSERLDPPIFIGKDEAITRMDYGYYAWKKDSRVCVQSEVDLIRVDVLRGSVPTSQALQNGWSVLHTADCSPKHDLANFEIPEKFSLHSTLPRKVIAEPGDVLMARVGRDLVRRVAKVERGTAVISDCLYVLRSAEISGEQIYSQLTSDQGQQWLNAHIHGACAQFVNKGDLLKFPFFYE